MSSEDKKELAKEVVKLSSWKHALTWTIQVLGFTGILFMYNEIKHVVKTVDTWNYTATHLPIHESVDSLEHATANTKIDCLMHRVDRAELVLASIKHK